MNDRDRAKGYGVMVENTWFWYESWVSGASSFVPRGDQYKDIS
jgi:hypothetical protein